MPPKDSIILHKQLQWGTKCSIHETMGDISHLKHYQENINYLLKWSLVVYQNKVLVCMKQTKKHNLHSLNVPLHKSQNTEKQVSIMDLNMMPENKVEPTIIGKNQQS